MGIYRKPKHLGACPMQPKMMARLSNVLPDLKNPNVIIPFWKYKGLCRKNADLPSATILFATWGKWSTLAHAFGLITWEEFEQYEGGKSLLPATLAELRRLSVEFYGGKIGPCFSDYRESMNPATGAQSTKTILKKSGTWKNALAFVGLRLESPRFYWHAREWRHNATTATNGVSH